MARSEKDVRYQALLTYWKFYHGDTPGSSGVLNEYIDDFVKYDLLHLTFGDRLDYDKSGMTLLHKICDYGELAMLKMICNKVSTDKLKQLLAIKDSNGNTPMDLANADIKEYLLFFLNNQNSDSMQQLNKESTNLFKHNLIIDTFYQSIKNHNDSSLFLNTLLDVMTKLLNDKDPISDDLLLLCVKYCKDTSADNGTIKRKKDLLNESFVSVVQDCLDTHNTKNEPLHEFNKWYFREFVQDSKYWYLSQSSVKYTNGSKVSFSTKVNPNKRNDNKDINNINDNAINTLNKMTENEFDTLLDDITSDSKNNNNNDESDTKLETSNQLDRQPSELNDATDELMCDDLSSFVHGELSTQRAYIKKSIEAIKNGSIQQQQDWEHLTHYSEDTSINKDKFVNLLSKKGAKEVAEGPRQDMIKNGLKCDYEEAQLDKIQLLSKYKQTKRYNFQHLYAINIYLESLLIRAHMLNDKFQSDIANAQEGDENSPKLWEQDKNKETNIVYADAPVKLRRRCVVKAESDYSNCRFPSTAQLCDLVRCSLIFNSVSDFIDGINKFEKKFGDKIVRIKNGYNAYADGAMPLEYKDLKYNIIVEDKEKAIAIIGEVQFLLKFMDVAKHMGHRLYSVIRRNEYLHNVHRLYSLQYKTSNKYNVLDHCVGKLTYDAFGLALASNLEYAVLNAKFDQKHSTILHHICRRLWLPGYRLYHAFMMKYLHNKYNADLKTIEAKRKEIMTSMLNYFDNAGATPMTHIILGANTVTNDVNTKYNFFNTIFSVYYPIINMDKVLEMYYHRGERRIIRHILDVYLEHDMTMNLSALHQLMDMAANMGYWDTLSDVLDSKYLKLTKNVDFNTKSQHSKKDESILEFCRSQANNPKDPRAGTYKVTLQYMEEFDQRRNNVK